MVKVLVGGCSQLLSPHLQLVLLALGALGPSSVWEMCKTSALSETPAYEPWEDILHAECNELTKRAAFRAGF